MKTRYIIAFAAAALMLSGCQKNDFETVYAGGDSIVKFEPSVSDGGTDANTKGELYNETGDPESLGKYVDEFMVAAWNIPSPGDPAQIIPDNTAKAFTGGYVSDNQQYQKVKKRTGAGSTEYWMTVQPYTPEGGAATIADDEYIWKKNESKTFYAYANLPASGATVTNTASGQKLQYTVPATATAQKDILLGFYSGDGKTGTGESAKPTGTAGIVFQHPLTAVKFIKGLMDEGLKIKSIRLDGVAASGNVTMDNAGVLSEWNIEGSCNHTVNQTNDSGLPVDGTTSLIGESFLLIPQESGTHNVTVTFTTGVSVSATIPSCEWEAGKVNTYTLNYGNHTKFSLTVTPWDEKSASIDLDDKDYQYEFNVTNGFVVFSNTTDVLTKTFSIESYRHEKGDDIIPNREPVAYSAEYSTDGGNTWLPFDEAAVTATGLSGLIATDNAGATKPTSHPLTAIARVSSEEFNNVMRWNGEEMVGTSESPVDLSRMEIGGEGDGTLPQNTSNCYIVKHPGYYMIPCVYGNSIQNGTATTAGYKTSVTGSQTLSTFLNAKKAAISNAWIIDDCNPSKPKAAMIWCDYKTPSGNTLVSNVSLINGGAGQSYIRFQTLPANELASGNALLVLYDDANSNGIYNEGEALWNWHIWVTDADLSVNNVAVHDSNAKFMNRNLGWCEGLNGIRYAAMNDVQIRLVQQRSSNSQIITVSRPEVLVGYTTGASNLYYQQGRKDPFQGGRTMYGPDGSPVNYSADTSHDIFPKTVSAYMEYAQNIIQNSIKYPFTLATNSTYDKWYYNLWSLNADAAGIQEIPITKTVYDPCPYGYRMPGQKAFSGFGYDEHGVINNDNVKASKFKNPADEYDDNLVFPWAGYIYASIDDESGRTKGTVYQDACRLNVCDYKPSGEMAPNHHRFCIYFGATEVNTQNTADRAPALCVRPILEQ